MMNRRLKSIANSVLLAGLIVLLLGAYYSVVKAGIPYQDPPPELQLRYAVNLAVGETLLRAGWTLALTGLAGRAALYLVHRKKERAGGQETHAEKS